LYGVAPFQRPFNFRGWPLIKVLKLYQPRREVVAQPREVRESRHKRGYDHDWERRSARHRAQSPVCIECERKGYIVPVDVVDHKIPVTERDHLRLDPKNWWSLCHSCHNGIKRRMERYAIKAGMVDFLPLWCDDPSSRPRALQQSSRRKLREEMIV
jgi:hypothetical protein